MKNLSLPALHFTTMSCQDIQSSHVVTFMVMGISIGFLVIVAISEAILRLNAKNGMRKHQLAIVIIHGSAALSVGIFGSWVLRVMC